MMMHGLANIKKRKEKVLRRIFDYCRESETENNMVISFKVSTSNQLLIA
jgi:hypothetical protein